VRRALRNSLKARNLHRLDTIADDSKNDIARVASIKALEQISDVADEKRGNPGQLPGLQIIIVQRADAPVPADPVEVFSRHGIIQPWSDRSEDHLPRVLGSPWRSTAALLDRTSVLTHERPLRESAIGILTTISAPERARTMP